jgi:hypothetical protein
MGIFVNFYIFTIRIIGNEPDFTIIVVYFQPFTMPVMIELAMIKRKYEKVKSALEDDSVIIGLSRELCKHEGFALSPIFICPIFG